MKLHEIKTPKKDGAAEVKAALEAKLKASDLATKAGLTLYDTRIDDLKVGLQQDKRGFLQVMLVLQARPGVYHELGNLVGDKRYDEIKKELDLKKTGSRNDIDSDEAVLNFAKTLASKLA